MAPSQATDTDERRPGRAERATRIAALCLAALLPASPAGADPGWRELEPLFVKRCVMCHSGDHAARGLKLDSYDGVMAGSDRGAVLVPGDLSASELVRRVRGESRPRMPFLSTPLDPADLALIERWVETGSPRDGSDAGR